MSSILDGIRILDLTRLQPGPYCTMILGDLGAEVIKIENPRGGDYLRWYPPLGKSDSGLFLALNRNKLSMRLNLWTESGREIFFRLLDTADIVIEQYRPGTLAQIGIEYQQLRDRNPRIILASISAYGQSGPYSKRAGHDINLISLCGILDGTGLRHGKPVIPAVQMADMAGSLWAALSVLAALLEREHSGQGQYIDISLLESVLSFQSLAAGGFFLDNHIPERGNEPLNGACAWYNVYPTADDKYLAIGMLEFKFWRIFCKAIGCEKFTDKQFEPREVQEEMIHELEIIIRQKSLQEWMDILGPLDICVTPVNNLKQALDDEHLQSRQMVQEIPHPLEGVIKCLRLPVKFDRSPAALRRPPPGFGQHTEEILQQLGYDQEIIEKFRSQGVI